MPINATPAAEPSNPCCDQPTTVTPVTPVACDSQLLVAPNTPYVRRREILQRMRAVRVRSGQQATIQWVLKNQDGVPINTTECGFTDSSLSVSVDGLPRKFILRVRESLSGNCYMREYDAQSIDAETGTLTFKLDDAIVSRAGIYIAEVALIEVQEDLVENVLISNVFYLNVETGLFGQAKGPPTIAEIRLHLRDSAAEENFLLDSTKFDDAEIAASIQRPVMQWNETPPVVQVYTTHTFPHRFHWLEAICANLFLIAAEHFRANQLEYQAGGISLNDMSKEQNYEAAAQRRSQTWKDWMKRTKVADNYDAGWGGYGSSYAY